ncbi:hypothetical protein IC615_22630 [Serratia ureilytica]
MTEKVLDEMERKQIPVLIGRAPEFYGPGKTQSFTNALIVDRLKAGKTARAGSRRQAAHADLDARRQPWVSPAR